MIGDRTIFQDLCATADARGMYVELHAGEFTNGTKERRDLSKVLVATGTGRNRRMIVERPVVDGDVDRAATGCLAYLNGTVA